MAARIMAKEEQPDNYGNKHVKRAPVQNKPENHSSTG
jgi:hypothetical protein